MTKTKNKFEWTSEHQEISDKILNDIKAQTLLSTPDYNKYFTLETDASAYSVGAILYQEHKLIELYSKKLGASLQNYTNTERECLAIIEGVKHFRNIIYGINVEIRTDHANLLTSPDIQSARIQRWKLIIEEFGGAIVYIKGEMNQAADMLSRCNHVGETQRPEIYQIIKEILTKGQILIKNPKEGEKLKIKKDGSLDLVEKLHRLLGHPGTSTFINTINRFQ